jgi:NAD+ synthase (glutamine-hydrolysing)
MLADIGHPAAAGRAVHDVTYENVQAGERTSHLFRLANMHGALVVGTSDLSELALGWCTYGVGDQMSHYAVNASVPKTLVQHVVGWGGWPTRGASALRRAQCRRAYSMGEIRRWLDVFLVRFFETSQFKRSAIPNAPKVGSGGALSPRADWRAPSDGRAAAWRAQLALIPEHE